MSSVIIREPINVKTFFTPEERSEIRQAFREQIADKYKEKSHTFTRTLFNQIRCVLENWRLGVSLNMSKRSFRFTTNISEKLLGGDHAYSLFNQIVGQREVDYTREDSEWLRKTDLKILKVMQNAFLKNFELSLDGEKTDPEAAFCHHMMLGDVLKNTGSKCAFTVSWTPYNTLYCLVNKTVAEDWSSESSDDEDQVASSGSSDNEALAATSGTSDNDTLAATSNS